jgi:DNA-binding NarL/FixJ family response regulator
MMDPRSLAALVEAIEEAVGGGSEGSSRTSDALPIVALVAYFTYLLQREDPNAHPVLLPTARRATNQRREADEDGEWTPPLRSQFRPTGHPPAQSPRVPRERAAEFRANDEEREILALLAEGLDARAVAAQMSMSYSNVLLRLQSLLDKLEIHTTSPEGEHWRASRAPFEPIPVRENAAPFPRESLTAREREVLAYMADGLDNRAIADKLVVSYATVRSHVQNILEKLDAHSRIEAVVFARERGLLDR